MKKILFALAAALVVLAGCEKEEEKFVPQLSVDKHELPTGFEAAELSFAITANCAWTITTDAGEGETWFEVAPTEGDGNAEVTVKVNANENEKGRTAVITVSYGPEELAQHEDIALVQDAEPVRPEDRTEEDVAVRARGGEKTLAVSAKHYTLSIPEGCDWISEVSRNVDSKSLTLSFSANPGDDSREATVLVQNGDGETVKTFNVKQSWRNIEPGELLIEEVFFTSNLIPETGKTDKFKGDQYFRLTNNCDETLYADGIMIMEAKINSMSKFKYLEPNKDKFADVGTVYCIPGSGKDVPLDPGKSLIIANNAQNHLATNSNSFDLSHADFEWYDKSTSASNQDIDNPDITNLDIWFTYTNTVWILHDRGFLGYAIAFPPASVNKEKFLADYPWTGDYINEVTGTQMSISKAYKVPNEWVIDAVNLAVTSLIYTMSFDATLDSGYTYCGKIDKDPERYGKSVRRKVDENGKLVDTNNSTNDFIPDATPTLKENPNWK